MTNSREKFEAFFRALYIKQGFVSSSDELYEAWLAGRESMREELENFQPAKEEDLPAILRRQAT